VNYTTAQATGRKIAGRAHGREGIKSAILAGIDASGVPTHDETFLLLETKFLRLPTPHGSSLCDNPVRRCRWQSASLQTVCRG
jgi:hypothetical protein